MTLGLLGCATSPSPVEPLVHPAATQMEAPISASDAPPTGPAREEVSYLKLNIKWPEQGYRVAALPTSTNALAIEVKQGSARLAQQLVSREGSASLAAVSIPLKAATNLQVNVKAYRELSPDLDTAIPIAWGTATGVTLVRSKSKSLSITLTPATIPSITALVPTTGSSGATVSISGLNLDDVTGATPSVYFGVSDEARPWTGALAPIVVPISSTSLEAVVPGVAVTGKVVVVVDGIPSVVNPQFTVDNSIQAAISAKRMTGVFPFRRLGDITVQVQNPAPTQQNGTLVVTFSKSGQAVETQDVSVSLAPGEVRSIAVTPLKSADDAAVAMRPYTQGEISIIIE